MKAQLDSSQLGYIFGVASLVMIWLLSWHFTGKMRPWALALGYNGQISTSLLQFTLFTAMTVFAYVTTFFARVFAAGSASTPVELPGIPLNLLILMGLASATAVGSKQITLSWLEQGKILETQDASTIARGRDGETELTKVQMTIWMFVAAAVYLAEFFQFMATKGYSGPAPVALPDIDTTLLILTGASQGTYIAGKIVSRVDKPVITEVLPQSIKAGLEVKVLGVLFGETKQGNDLLVRFADGVEDFVPLDQVTEWTDTAILFKFPSAFPATNRQAAGKISLSVRTSAGVSNAKELTVI